MSRQNKVNPGQYTQRGRLAQDDMARELKVQDASISSQKSWQPSQTPWPEATSGDAEAEDGPASQTSEAREKPRKPAAKAKPRSKAKTASKAKTTSKTKATSRAKAPRVGRKAVLARSAGKGSALLKAGRTKKKAGTTAKRKR